jgi:hypothetical protein
MLAAACAALQVSRIVRDMCYVPGFVIPPIGGVIE